MGIGFSSSSYNHRKVRPVIDMNLLLEEYVEVLPPNVTTSSSANHKDNRDNISNIENDTIRPRIQIIQKPVTKLPEIQENSEEEVNIEDTKITTTTAITIEETPLTQTQSQQINNYDYLSSSPANEIIENNLSPKKKKKNKKKKNKK